MLLNKTSKYSRISNIILENDIPVLELKQKFVDLDTLSNQAIDYMNLYIEMFPELVKTIHSSRVIPKEEIMQNRCSKYNFIDFDEQLKLF